jgi:tetratricopeptide (TPR) repeat protein
MSSYQLHVERMEEQITSLRREIAAAPHPTVASQCRLFSSQFQLLSLIGEIGQMTALYDLIEVAIASSAVRSDLWLVQAYAALKLHRFADAERILRAEPARLVCPHGLLIDSDLDMQQGRYASAREKIVRALTDEVTWEGLARLAFLTGLSGDIETADHLYLRAQDELTIKQMHAYAWIEVQRGVLDFQRGEYARAGAHYDRSNQAYSGYWLIEERIAEVKGAQGYFAEAIADYRRIYEKSARPECAHALGDLYALSGAIVNAHEWKATALHRYLQSASCGEVHYYHYLVELCCELPAEQEQALRWARSDEQMRHNYLTQGNVAWALYRCGRVAEAEQWISHALESGVVCARLFLQAACVYAAAGRVQLGNEYYRRASAVNAVPAKARLVMPQPRALQPQAHSL